jgi:hypothetical protein
MLISEELVADFSAGCAGRRISHLLFATHPYRSAIREWFYASRPCAVILASANLYSLLLYLVPRNKRRAG